MDVLDGYARAGEPEGLIVIADEQTAGRGRAGRTWVASAGRNVLCSILLRPDVPPEHLGTLPLEVGIAVAETVESFVVERCRLKWPNDVLVIDRKISGILIQSRISTGRIDFVNLGIGINVDAARESLPDGATSILAERGAPVGCTTVLDALLMRLNARYAAFVATGGNPDLTEWRSRAQMLGERVTVIAGEQTVNGVFEDVDPVGRLVLRLGSGEQIRLTHGDVLRGPRSAGI